MLASVRRLPLRVVGPVTFFLTAPATEGVSAARPNAKRENATGRRALPLIISPSSTPAAAPMRAGATDDDF